MLDAEVTRGGGAIPDSDIFLDEHHRLAPPRRDHPAGPTASTSLDVGSLNGTYVNRDRVEEAQAGPTVTSSRSASFKLVFFTGH